MPFPIDGSPSTLWTLTGDDKLASCKVRFVPIGVEARVRTFPYGDEALKWAEEERRKLLANGCAVPASPAGE